MNQRSLHPYSRKIYTDPIAIRSANAYGAQVNM